MAESKPAESKSGLGYGEIIGLGLLLVALAVIVRPWGGAEVLVPVGTPLPDLLAEGWINAPKPPSRESLAGKVVVVDCWATWCGPCRVSLPRLIDIHESYRDSNVEFVGLTSEGGIETSAVQQFVESVDGFDWPVGYGSELTQEMLGIQVLPTLIVFGKDGRAVWSSTATDGMMLAIDEALAKK